APSVAGICERVDGLPLAIELAAARVKLFNPQALLARLETSAAVLGAGSRDLPGRQQTLMGAIAWSYDLLDDSHRRLFSRFSAFARGANLEQAESVCGPESELGVDVLTGLDELADQSLMRRMPDYEEPRLLMLHVIREYAADRLRDSGEEAAIRDRHAAAYQALAEAAAPHLFGAEQKTWLDRLDLDHDNFRAAFDWSISRGDVARALCLGAAFWRFWQMRGHLREGRTRIESIIAMPRVDEHPDELERALEAAGGITYWQGDIAATQAYYDRCLVLARASGDQRRIANALYNASFPFQVTRQDPAQGKVLLEEALPIYRQLGDDSGIAQCLWGLGQCQFRLNDFAAAIPTIDESIQLFRRLGNQFGLGWALFVRSIIAIYVDDLDEAKSKALEALQIFSRADDVSGAVLVLNGLAEVIRRQGDRIRAATLAGAASAQEVSSGATLGTVLGSREGWRMSLEDLTGAEAAARAEGQAMTFQQAVAYALGGATKPEAAAGASD
ncbi:MAG TPA: hypothetical protein VHO95_03210, partial [Candidatus Dormibacteraeota bacterium]|nr:hypothetical protein [Candidatus Dormibacteraeota bacterium]